MTWLRTTSINNAKLCLHMCGVQNGRLLITDDSTTSHRSFAARNTFSTRPGGTADRTRSATATAAPDRPDSRRRSSAAPPPSPRSVGSARPRRPSAVHAGVDRSRGSPAESADRRSGPRPARVEPPGRRTEPVAGLHHRARRRRRALHARLRPRTREPRRADRDPRVALVRALEPIPTVAFSWAFFEEFELPPGESFAYRYRLVADGAWDRDRVGTYVEGLPW